jgi:hypothetical protein
VDAFVPTPGGEDFQPAASTQKAPKDTVDQESTKKKFSSSTSSSSVRKVHLAVARIFVFLELFAGAAGLSGAIKKFPIDIVVKKPLDCATGDWDITSADGFEAALNAAADTDWMHAAPPCRTFTRRRRSDKFGSVKVLRSNLHPEGFGDPEAELGNLVARRLAAICRGLSDRGKYWSIENPKDSFLWDLKEYIKLSKIPGVQWVVFDQCAFGGLSK